MTRSSTLLVTSALISLIFTSCSGPWSQEQKNALSTVSITPPTHAEDSRKGSNVVEQSTGGSVGAAAVGGGLIPALIGIAVDASVTAHRKGKFEDQHGSIEDAAAAMDKSVPNDIGKRLRDKMTAQLKNDAFFGPRLRPTSPNRFDGELYSYGLVARDTIDDVPQIGARLQARIWLEDAEGETPLDITKIANSSNTFPATTLMSQRKRVEQLFDEACNDFARQVQEEVDKKLDR
jgi:BMFP domain-containing protein YqiC